MRFHATIIVEAETPEDFENVLKSIKKSVSHEIIAREYPLPAFYDPDFDCPICNRDGFECGCNATEDQRTAAKASREYLAKLICEARDYWGIHHTMPTELWTDMWGLDSEIRKLVD